MSQLDLQRIIDRQSDLARQLDLLVGEVRRLQDKLAERSAHIKLRASPRHRPTTTA